MATARKTVVQDLNALARKIVGDGEGPNLYFVSQYNRKGGTVLAVVRELEQAIAIAEDYKGAMMIEDRKTGVVWENEVSRRFQDRQPNPSPSHIVRSLKF